MRQVAAVFALLFLVMGSEPFVGKGSFLNRRGGLLFILIGALLAWAAT